jgi:hypothetical protein
LSAQKIPLTAQPRKNHGGLDTTNSGTCLPVPVTRGLLQVRGRFQRLHSPSPRLASHIARVQGCVPRAVCGSLAHLLPQPRRIFSTYSASFAESRLSLRPARREFRWRSNLNPPPARPLQIVTASRNSHRSAVVHEHSVLCWLSRPLRIIGSRFTQTSRLGPPRIRHPFYRRTHLPTLLSWNREQWPRQPTRPSFDIPLSCLRSLPLYFLPVLRRLTIYFHTVRPESASASSGPRRSHDAGLRWLAQ